MRFLLLPEIIHAPAMGDQEKGQRGNFSVNLHVNTPYVFMCAPVIGRVFAMCPLQPSMIRPCVSGSVPWGGTRQNGCGERQKIRTHDDKKGAQEPLPLDTPMKRSFKSRINFNLMMGSYDSSIWWIHQVREAISNNDWSIIVQGEMCARSPLVDKLTLNSFATIDKSITPQIQLTYHLLRLIKSSIFPDIFWDFFLD